MSANAQTQVVSGINVGTSLDYDGSHLYIAELFGNKISRMDLTLGASSLETVASVSRPEGVAINGNHIYTAGISSSGYNLADISGGLPATSNTIVSGSSFRTIVHDPTFGLYLIQTNGGSNTKIYSISGSTTTFITDVGVGDIRGGTIEGSEMYLSSRAGGAIYKFDLNNVATPTLVKSGLNQPYEIDIVNNYLYFASEGGILGKIDLTNTAASPTIFVNNTLGSLAGIEVIGQDIYFTSWGNNAVYKINDPALPCIVNIPDANFKAYLVGHGGINTNGDAEIQCSEASAFAGVINCSILNISNLTGIEAFTALVVLRCNNNSLTSLDVSANTALLQLLCHNNQITTLDVSANPVLNYLLCDNNSLTTLNVANGNNSNFVRFSAGGFANSNLDCIQIDQGYTPPSSWVKELTSNYSTDCTATTYVNHTATGNNDGTSWADAYTDLNDALTNTYNDSNIWVASGTYTPHASDRNIAFDITISNLSIYGGFAGTETQILDRVLGANETIISGDLQGNDVNVADFVSNYSNATRNTDNSYHVINITAGGDNLLLDGLTISDAHGNLNATEQGGAILKEKTVAKLTLKNCIIKNNLNRNGNAGLLAEFELNNGSGTRGELNIENCQFINNMSRWATGIYSLINTNTNVDITIVNTLFDKNVSGDLNSSTAKSISGSAGWFRMVGNTSDANFNFSNNTLVNNLDNGTGQGLSASSHAVLAISKTIGYSGILNAEIANNIFWNNKTNGNAVTRSITDLYKVPVASVNVYNSIDENNFIDNSITSTTNTSNVSPFFTSLANGKLHISKCFTCCRYRR